MSPVSGTVYVAELRNPGISCGFCQKYCKYIWCCATQSEVSNLRDEVKEFLDNDCKAGEYAAFTIMVNKQHLEALVRHLNEFDNRCGLFENGTENDAILGKDNAKVLNIVEDDSE